MTEHAEREREADSVTAAELEEALGSDSLELVEDYPNDPRGHSALFLGFTKKALPVHAVIGLASQDVIAIVTVYRPDPLLWDNWRKRASR